jgi:hypothetical protein
MRETVAAIVRLPEAQREALVGTSWPGKTYDELGAEHGWSTPATKSLLWRARTTLAAERRKWAAAVTQPFAALGAARDWLGHAAERPLTALGTLAPSGADALGCAAAVALTSAAVVIPPATAPDGRAAERPAAEVVAAAPAGEGAGDRRDAAAAPAGRAPVRPPRAAPLLPAPRPRRAGPAGVGLPRRRGGGMRRRHGSAHGFSLGALRRAERTLPAQVEQYTDCGDRISRALLRSA